MSQRIVNILAIESSCDDTSVAVLRGNLDEDVPRLLALSVQSQNEVHEKFGGVVPELASRSHLKNLLPCLKKVLAEANIELNEIDAFAATSQPGLIGCLLIGHSAAKTLSYLWNKPLLSCHHIHSHLMSVYLENRPEFPFLAAVASGGHTSLYHVKDYDDFEDVGLTLDDALGEAFDKGAKLLGLEFPGGPEIDRLSKSGDAKAFKFGRVNVSGLDFSFSGLKSELQRLVKKNPDAKKEDVAASYQSALLDHFLQKTTRALQDLQLKRVVIVGGVARNSELRHRLAALKDLGEIEKYFAPRPELCTDNAAMVGVMAFRLLKRGEISDLRSDVSSTQRPKRKKS